MPLNADRFYLENSDRYHPERLDSKRLEDTNLTFYPVGGIETEYFVSGMSGNGRVDAEKIGGCDANFHIFRGLCPTGRPDIFLENGGRFYMDRNNIEFATGEARSLDELIYAVAAGHRIVNLGGSNAEKDYQGKEEDADRLKLKAFAYNRHANRTDLLRLLGTDEKKEVSVGTHENYLASRLVPLRTLMNVLLPFFVTRIVYSGSGLVLPENLGRYEISSRAGFISSELSLDTIEDRGIYNSRDEPHADRNRFRRSHIISGESVMSDFQRKLTIGTTRLVYALAELIALKKINPLNEVAGLREPVETLHQVSKDLELQQRLCRFGKEERTAVWTNRQYFDSVVSNYFRETIREMVGAYDFDWTIHHWDRVLTALAGNPKELQTELDYLIKLATFEELIKAGNSRGNGSWDSMAPKLNQSYHRVHPENQLFEELVKRGRVMVLHEDREERIQQAMWNPPKNTRAEGRRRLMDSLKQNGSTVGVNWSVILQHEPEKNIFVGNDPRIPEFK